MVNKVAETVFKGVANVASIGIQGWILIVTFMVPLMTAAYFVGANIQSHRGLEQTLLHEINSVKTEVIAEIRQRDIKIDYAYEKLLAQDMLSISVWNAFIRNDWQKLSERVSNLERRCDVNCEKIDALTAHLIRMEKWLNEHDQK